jgi:hypothetical protein
MKNLKNRDFLRYLVSTEPKVGTNFKRDKYRHGEKVWCSLSYADPMSNRRSPGKGTYKYEIHGKLETKREIEARRIFKRKQEEFLS